MGNEDEAVSIIVFENDTGISCVNGYMEFGSVSIDTGFIAGENDEEEFDADYYWRQDDED